MFELVFCRSSVAGGSGFWIIVIRIVSFLNLKLSKSISVVPIQVSDGQSVQVPSRSFMLTFVSPLGKDKNSNISVAARLSALDSIFSNLNALNQSKL